MNHFKIKTYTAKELYKSYGCSDKTFKKWMALFCKDVGPLAGKLYTPKQVKVIVERLGEPCLE